MEDVCESFTEYRSKRRLKAEKEFGLSEPLSDNDKAREAAIQPEEQRRRAAIKVGDTVRNVYGQTGKVVDRQGTNLEVQPFGSTGSPENWHVSKSFKQRNVLTHEFAS